MRKIVILSPTNKWGTKTEYTNLRKFLLRDGYLRIAPEVFMRITPTRRASEKQSARTAISCYNWDMKKSSCVRANSTFSIERHLWHKM